MVFPRPVQGFFKRGSKRDDCHDNLHAVFYLKCEKRWRGEGGGVLAPKAPATPLSGQHNF